MISLDFIYRTLADYGKEYGESVIHCSADWANKRKVLAHQMMNECSSNPHVDRPALIKTYLDWSTIAELVTEKEKRQPVLTGLPREYRIAKMRYYELQADGNHKVSETCRRKMDELLRIATHGELRTIELQLQDVSYA